MRVVIISVGLFLADLTIPDEPLAVLRGASFVLAALSLFTMLQRIHHVYRQSLILDAERAAATDG